MRKVRRTRVWVSLGLAAVFAFAVAGAADAGLFGIFGKSSKTKTAKTVKGAPVKPSSLLVFPFDLSKGVSLPSNMGDELAGAFRGMLEGNSKYSAILYSEKLAPVKRARQDNPPLAEKDTLNPFTEDLAVPLRLSRLMAADYYLVGAVEDIQLDASKKSAQMTVSLQMADGKTGRLMKTLMVTGRTPESAHSAGADDAIALAAGDAVSKLKEQFLEEPKGTETSSAAPRIDVKPVEEKPAPVEPAAKAPAPAAPSAPAGAVSGTHAPAAGGPNGAPRGPRPGVSAPPPPPMPTPRTPGAAGSEGVPTPPPAPEL